MRREPITIDNDTGQVIEPVITHTPHAGDPIITFTPGAFGNQTKAPVFGTDQSGNSGFGPTRKMLDTQPILTAPWLTPELAEQEIAIGGFR